MKNLRKYGNAPFNVAVIHGGPGAPGEMAPVARELSSITGVLEPLQSESTIEGQIGELGDVLEKNGDLPVTLIGCHGVPGSVLFLLPSTHNSPRNSSSSGAAHLKKNTLSTL